MEFNKARLIELYEQEQSKTLAAKAYCQEMGIKYDETFRKKANAHILKSERSIDHGVVWDDVEDVMENNTVTETNQYEKVALLSAVRPDGSIMNIREYCEFYKIPFEHVRTFKLVTHTGKGAYYNIASNAIESGDMEKFYDKLLEEIAKIPGKPKGFIRDANIEDGHLLVIDPCDLHIGKLADSFETGEDYDSQIAIQRAKEGVRGVLNKSRGFSIDKILFIGGNDILHIDTPKRTTTSGTPQDTDGMWYSNFLLAKELYIDILEELLKVADVHFVFNPSNHDWTHGFFLADVIQTYFKDCPDITFDCSINHRKYFKYHSNLIGSTHGDSAKTTDLPLLMAHESPDWSLCKHKYIYTHHVHHKSSKDYMGVNVEAMRSASGTDGWHHRSGYAHAPKAVEGFLHSKMHGQICRITHIF